MKDNNKTAKSSKKDSNKKVKNDFPGYPTYPASEDIFSHDKEEMDIDPENIAKTKTLNEKEGAKNEKDFKEDMSGDDLDVPGSELDDEQESKGSEDEENNHYSIGGENHLDLEENNA